MVKVKVKICGLSRECDIAAVNVAMPDYIGFVFYAGSHRCVSPKRALELGRGLRPPIGKAGVFVNEGIETIQSVAGDGIIDIIQLHGDEDEGFVAQVKSLTGKPVIKAIPVRGIGDVQRWQDSCADYLLLDNPRGGSGECFDWRVIGHVKKPFFLAGGLNADNIHDAISKIHPFAVDISSGVETHKLKDAEKIKEIVSHIREKFTA